MVYNIYIYILYKRNIRKYQKYIIKYIKKIIINIKDFFSINEY